MTTERTCTISNEKISAIAIAAGCNDETAREILDPTYNYWSDRGDSTRDEHFDFLENKSVDEIAGWVRSILADQRTE